MNQIRKKGQEIRICISAALWLIKKSIKEVQLFPVEGVELLRGTVTLSHRMTKYIFCYRRRKYISEWYEMTLIGIKRQCML